MHMHRQKQDQKRLLPPLLTQFLSLSMVTHKWQLNDQQSKVRKMQT